jgi:hypothetical protein
MSAGKSMALTINCDIMALRTSLYARVCVLDCRIVPSSQVDEKEAAVAEKLKQHVISVIYKSMSTESRMELLGNLPNM